MFCLGTNMQAADESRGRQDQVGVWEDRESVIKDLCPNDGKQE